MEQNKIIPPTPPTSGSNINNPFERSLDELKEKIKKFNTEKVSYYDVRNSYEYLKGFYDATYNFMQTFTKLIDVEKMRNKSK